MNIRMRDNFIKIFFKKFVKITMVEEKLNGVINFF